MKLVTIVCFLWCISGLVASFRSTVRSPTNAMRSMRMISDEQEFRTYASYGVYKGKGALNVKPIPPTYQVKEKSQSVVKEGALLFEFAPAGANPREYDWSKKIMFSLSANECGEFLRHNEPTNVEFMHDPNAQSESDHCKNLPCDLI